jgi:hypothetical protein
MSDQTINPRATIGGNRPVLEEMLKEINDDLPARLQAECGEVIDRARELVENAKSVPDVIENEDQEANATDIVSQMNKHHKIADSRRLGIGALPRQTQAIINSFFGDGALTPLEKAVKRIDPAVTKFKRIKAERELREREEKERLAREEAERQRKATEEAQRKQREAEAARQRALDEERRAKEAAVRARQEAEAAEQRRKEAERRRIEQERLAAEAESKRKKDAADRAARKAKEDAEQAQRDKLAAEEAARAERERAKTAKTEAALTHANIADANREVRTAASLTRHADADVRKAERAAGAKLSEVSGVKGEYGGQSSLRTRWVGIIMDRKKLDLEALRDFMSDDDLQKALDKFVSVHKGGRKLKGAVIQEESNTTFR